MRQHGFTLIELMIVVAVIAILTAIAVPSYQQYVRKARRTQAKADLLEVAQLLERKFTVDRDYRTFALVPPLTQSPSVGRAYYDLSLAAISQSSYTLRAVPIGDQNRDVCGTLTVSQTGGRTPATDGCWP